MAIEYEFRGVERGEHVDYIHLAVTHDHAPKTNPFVRVEFLSEDGTEVQRFNADPSGWTQVEVRPGVHSVRVLVQS